MRAPHPLVFTNLVALALLCWAIPEAKRQGDFAGYRRGQIDAFNGEWKYEVRGNQWVKKSSYSHGLHTKSE